MGGGWLAARLSQADLTEDGYATYKFEVSEGARKWTVVKRHREFKAFFKEVFILSEELTDKLKLIAPWLETSLPKWVVDVLKEAFRSKPAPVERRSRAFEDLTNLLLVIISVSGAN